MINEVDLIKTLKTKDFVKFPEAIKKVCTEEEFNLMMTSHN
jgi:hypothetical protein